MILSDLRIWTAEQELVFAFVAIHGRISDTNFVRRFEGRG